MAKTIHFGKLITLFNMYLEDDTNESFKNFITTHGEGEDFYATINTNEIPQEDGTILVDQSLEFNEDLLKDIPASNQKTVNFGTKEELEAKTDKYTEIIWFIDAYADSILDVNELGTEKKNGKIVNKFNVNDKKRVAALVRGIEEKFLANNLKLHFADVEYAQQLVEKYDLGDHNVKLPKRHDKATAVTKKGVMPVVITALALAATFGILIPLPILAGGFLSGVLLDDLITLGLIELAGVGALAATIIVAKKHATKKHYKKQYGVKSNNYDLLFNGEELENLPIMQLVELAKEPGSKNYIGQKINRNRLHAINAFIIDLDKRIASEQDEEHLSQLNNLRKTLFAKCKDIAKNDYRQALVKRLLNKDSKTEQDYVAYTKELDILTSLLRNDSPKSKRKGKVVKDRYKKDVKQDDLTTYQFTKDLALETLLGGDDGEGVDETTLSSYITPRSKKRRKNNASTAKPEFEYYTDKYAAFIANLTAEADEAERKERADARAAEEEAAKLVAEGAFAETNGEEGKNKKPGFFARLFGRKSEDTSAVAEADEVASETVEEDVKEEPIEIPVDPEAATAEEEPAALDVDTLDLDALTDLQVDYVKKYNDGTLTEQDNKDWHAVTGRIKSLKAEKDARMAEEGRKIADEKAKLKALEEGEFKYKEKVSYSAEGDNLTIKIGKTSITISIEQLTSHKPGPNLKKFANDNDLPYDVVKKLYNTYSAPVEYSASL